jgi:hypothetical protein
MNPALYQEKAGFFAALLKPIATTGMTCGDIGFATPQRLKPADCFQWHRNPVYWILMLENSLKCEVWILKFRKLTSSG